MHAISARVLEYSVNTTKRGDCIWRNLISWLLCDIIPCTNWVGLHVNLETLPIFQNLVKEGVNSSNFIIISCVMHMPFWWNEGKKGWTGERNC